MASTPREAWGDLATTAFVESSVLFRSLDADARRDLLQIAQVTTYAAGEVISPEGDDAFLILLEGTGSVLGRGPRGEIELYRLERGALFGVGRAIGQPRAAWLVASTEVTAVSFPAPVVTALTERFPKVRKLLEAVHVARSKEAASRLAS